MATNREVLLRKLTGLLKRITDADDDYTVTADQRAALMELESLTWNYPTPQQARGRTSSLSHGAKDDTDDSDDDDDDESYYMDIVPYDMTERLKEVNRALVEDPTPAECDRTITIRFREVIADYHSPRNDYPSDSDDGYGDSSDILYDAEEEEGEEGLTSLSSEVKEVLGGSINVADLAASSTQENDSSRLAHQGHNEATDIPKLQLDDQHDDAPSSVDEDLPEAAGSSWIPAENSFFMTNDRNASYSQTSVRDVETPKTNEKLPGSRGSKLDYAEEVEEAIDLVSKGSVSLVEESEKIYAEGPRSFGDTTTQDEVTATPSVSLFTRDTCSDVTDPTNFYLPAKSESDFASYDYSDDFEDCQEESESTGKENKAEREEEPIPPPSTKSESPPKAMPEPLPYPVPTPKAVPPTEGFTPSQDSQKQSLRTKENLVSGKVQSPPAEKKKKNTFSESVKTTPSEATRTKPKRVGASTPVIKPALLSSDKLNTIKDDSGRHKNRSATPASSASSSPLSSASSSSSSPSSSSSVSSYSVSRARGGSRTSISGPVRPTAHRYSGSTGKGPSGVGSCSPVRPPSSVSQNGAALASSGPTLGGRLTPPARVRKAASASDLHNTSRVTEETDDRRQQNDDVFRAWLRQKNKQAAQNKKHQQRPVGKRTAAEIAERRAQAEEAFQVWLSRKRDQLRLEKKLRGERRRLEDQSRYARTKSECEVAYKEWCRRKRDEVRTTARSGGAVPRSQSLERPWVQEKTRKLYSAYVNNH